MSLAHELWSRGCLGRLGKSTTLKTFEPCLRLSCNPHPSLELGLEAAYLRLSASVRDAHIPSGAPLDLDRLELNLGF
jgi:hypothetical protein